jgi:N-acetylmannosamine-6-phosphate 2-epimerase / N-acetylmannosamine kinase
VNPRRATTTTAATAATATVAATAATATPVPILAVDVGGSKCAVAIVVEADVVARTTVPTPASEGPAAVVDAVVAAGRALLDEAPQPPTLLGIASAGVVDAGRVRAMSPELLPGWTDFPLVASLSERFGVPATALNDAQAAAWGEARFGAGRGRTSLLFVTVSTGVGGGLVVGDRLWRGHTGLAGHVGHLRGYASGSVAGRGGPRPKLEALVSGTALARRAAESGQEAEARQVIAAAEDGAPWAKRIVDEAAEALAQALADARALVDPEVVVLGGGVGLNPSFRRALEAAIATLPASLRVTLVAAELGADAGLIGAADWARARLGTPPRT